MVIAFAFFILHSTDKVHLSSYRCNAVQFKFESFCCVGEAHNKLAAEKCVGLQKSPDQKELH